MTDPQARADALRTALDALEEIALAGMSGSGHESEEGMRDWHARQAWKFISIAARALEPIRAELASAPTAPAAQAELGVAAVFANLLRDCVGPLEISAAVIESDDDDQMTSLLDRLRSTLSQWDAVRATHAAPGAPT
jgi:nitroreductase